MKDSAEAIGRVVSDLRAGRFRTFKDQLDAAGASAKIAALDGVVVDATSIYRSIIDNPRAINLYEDFCIAPPWESAIICYQNQHGNVIAVPMMSQRYKAGETGEWENEQDPIDWTRVQWRIDSFMWCGGRSREMGPFPTTGPLIWWSFAVREDGSPADLHWREIHPQWTPRIVERDGRQSFEGESDLSYIVLLAALNFCNCRNVKIVEPQRSRPEMKRVARTGVRVHEINVFPLGTSAKSRAECQFGTPLTSVRGHFARYGVDGRGLLFGKYAGRYWIPQHARGSIDYGEIEQSYALRDT